jgi:hypothetical protein
VTRAARRLALAGLAAGALAACEGGVTGPGEYVGVSTGSLGAGGARGSLAHPLLGQWRRTVTFTDRTGRERTTEIRWAFFPDGSAQEQHLTRDPLTGTLGTTTFNARWFLSGGLLVVEPVGPVTPLGTSVETRVYAFAVRGATLVLGGDVFGRVVGLPEPAGFGG